MKKSLLGVAAGFMALSTAACDYSTSLCMEEYSCAINNWCSDPDNGYDQIECEQAFEERYDYCLDSVNDTRANVTGTCWEAYEQLNSCIWGRTSCGSDYEYYVDKMNDIIYSQCAYEAEKYISVCGGRFEDLYQWTF